eukprot:TRINITY_DN2749_c0_g1_i1.p1 TRINITY_DN2749_c0_g1~~TRINITY_DN2749_c0_g1_i1.p1  ORF type:complete len:494 (+),score=79.30 TRINITY_DN2749_c0_g1_i1:2-1483(+)
MSSRSHTFRGTVFAVAGVPHLRSKADLAQLIQNHGGRFSDVVDGSVNIVLSTDEMALVHQDPYKIQFFPDLTQAIHDAHFHSVPVVDDVFLSRCIQAGKLLDVNSYLIPKFKVDTESKYRVKEHAESALDPRVQDVIERLFDKNTINRSVVDLGVDVAKMSAITAASIKSAYSVLNQIEGKLQPAPGQTVSAHEAELKQLTQKYYTLIPHKDVSSVIKSLPQLKDKAAQLAALTDIEIAQRLMKQKGTSADLNMSPIDVNYRKLRLELSPVEVYRAEYAIISDMVLKTQSTEFFQGKKYDIELIDVFEVAREGEAERFAPFKKLPHHRLLFHGSRTSNYIGILSEGIRIAPPEAPVTGYFLGKGAYFADTSTVSAQYCRTTPAHPYGYLLLCDVAMGRMFQIAHGKYVAKSDLDDAGFHSLKCCGTLGPESSYDVQTPDGLIASVGNEGPTGVPISELVHNEYVVYDESQINIRYLLKVKISELDPTKVPSKK